MKPWPPHRGVAFAVNPASGGGGYQAPADLVQNGAFASDTVWTKGTGWAIAAGIATITAASTVLSQTGSYIPGRNYSATYTVSGFVAGTVTVSIGGTSGTARGSDATFTEVIKAGESGVLAFTGDTATLSIDNVSVGEL